MNGPLIQLDRSRTSATSATNSCASYIATYKMILSEVNKKIFSVSKYSSFTFELSSRMYFFQDVCITATQLCTRIMPIGHKLLLITAWASGWQNLFFDTDFLEKTFSYFILLNQKRIELIFIISLLQFWSAKRLQGDIVFVCLVIKPQRQVIHGWRLTRLSSRSSWRYPDRVTQGLLDRGTQTGDS